MSLDFLIIRLFLILIKKYVKQYGYGMTVAQFIIYIPMNGDGDCIFVRGGETNPPFIIS